jgi:hypothetical protein
LCACFRGELRIAEVVSRFTALDDFTKSLAVLGFKLIHKDDTNKMFVMLDFKIIGNGGRPPFAGKGKSKGKDGAKGKPVTPTAPNALKPCIYKKRWRMQDYSKGIVANAFTKEVMFIEIQFVFVFAMQGPASARSGRSSGRTVEFNELQ